MLRCYTAVKHSAIKFTALLFFFGFINLLKAQSQHPSFEPLFIFNEKSENYFYFVAGFYLFDQAFKVVVKTVFEN